MRAIRYVLVSLLLCATSVMAEPATDSTIRQLLEMTDSKKLIDGVQVQIEAQLNNTVQQALKGKIPNEKQQQAIDRMKDGLLSVIKSQLSWERLEPMYISIYKESFSQEELTSMVEFYKTPAGQALLKKMPTLLQRTLLEVQKILAVSAPQMQKVQQTFLADLAAANN